MRTPVAALRGGCRGFLLAASLAFCLACALVRPASATTGPTNYLPLSSFHVPEKVMPLYRGQYILTKAATGARLSGGELAIEITPYGYLYGVGQFYGYDSQGSQSSWTATLYNFHLSSRNVMIIDLLGQGGRPLLGRLFVTRGRSGALVGEINLGSRRYAISWRKFSDR